MRKARGESHPDHVGCLDDLANLYRDMGDDARAEPLYLQALEIASKMRRPGPRSDDPVDPCVSLACLRRPGRALSRPGRLYARARRPISLRGAVRELADHSVRPLNYAAGLDALANLYLEMGDDLRARGGSPSQASLERSGGRRTRSESHPDYAASPERPGPRVRGPG